MSDQYLIEGIDNDVLALVVTLIVVAVSFSLFINRFFLQSVTQLHPDYLAENNVLRQPSSGDHSQRTRSNGNSCPVCLVNNVSVPVETNCGHLFCALCMVSHIENSNRISPVRCPICRQDVSFIFTTVHAPTLNDAEKELLTKLAVYNRRFSGRPRSFLEVVQDMPMLIRHYVRNLYSLRGLYFIIRIRVVLVLLAALFYIISPLDIIPESMFGLLGLIDDFFILFCMSVYMSIMYRNFVAGEVD